MQHATPCARPDAADLVSGAYDASVESDGLTIDSPLGPVDLVAVERAAAGRRTPTTPAEREYVIDLLARGIVTGRTVAAGLGVSHGTLAALLAGRGAAA